MEEKLAWCLKIKTSVKEFLESCFSFHFKNFGKLRL